MRKLHLVSFACLVSLSIVGSNSLQATEKKEPFLLTAIDISDNTAYKSDGQRSQLIKEEQILVSVSSENKQFLGKGGVIPTGVCPDDLIGTFGIPADLPDGNIMEIAHELYFKSRTLAGDEIFKFYSESGSFYGLGIKSGNKYQITISEVDDKGKGIINLLMEDKPFCYAKFSDDGNNSYLYRMDYDKLSSKDFDELRQYLSYIWGATLSEAELKNIHYLYGNTYIEPGIGGASLLIPFQRLKK